MKASWACPKSTLTFWVTRDPLESRVINSACLVCRERQTQARLVAKLDSRFGMEVGNRMMSKTTVRRMQPKILLLAEMVHNWGFRPGAQE